MRNVLFMLADIDIDEDEIVKHISINDLEMLYDLSYIGFNKFTGRYYINGEILREYILFFKAKHML
ncbi:hypothetical protein ACFL52_04990 [Candidatus Margulisiibacteriota bacterium]